MQRLSTEVRNLKKSPSPASRQPISGFVIQASNGPPMCPSIGLSGRVATILSNTSRCSGLSSSSFLRVSLLTILPILPIRKWDLTQFPYRKQIDRNECETGVAGFSLPSADRHQHRLCNDLSDIQTEPPMKRLRHSINHAGASLSLILHAMTALISANIIYCNDY